MNKEKPIIFNTEMVKAILAGNKTQTRRVFKNVNKYFKYKDTFCNHLWPGKRIGMSCSNCWKEIIKKCPYEVGQTLWVRETWKYDGTIHNGAIRYKADNKLIRYTPKQLGSYTIDGKWKPSIYMPRKAARLFLKITNIRIERIQDISQEDSKAEGVISNKEKFGIKGGSIVNTHKWQFMYLWDSINKKRGYGWDENPYVWVYVCEEYKK